MIARIRSWPTGTQLLAAVGVAVVLGAIGTFVPAVTNIGMLLALVGVVAALGALAQWLWQHQHGTDWGNAFVHSAPPRGSDARVTRLSERVAAAVAGDAVAQAQLHETLRASAEERLRHRRGIALDGPESDPVAAAAALGPDLTAYLTNPPTSRLTATRVEAYLTTLEEL